MNKTKGFFSKLMNENLIFKLVLLFIVAMFLYSLFGRVPNIDDAWLGEHAYWLAKGGYVKSELMAGITQQDIRLLCHHKLFTLQGALFIKLFGFSLITLKSLTIIYFLLFLLIYYLNFYKKVLSSSEFLISIIILIVNASIFDYSFVYRPEIAVMTLGFISYLFLDKVLKNSSNQIFYVIISGLFAGLCFATHLNGIIFPIAGFLLLLWNRKVVLSCLFGLAILPTMAIYFYDFTPIYNLNFWLYQINDAPALDGISKMPLLLTLLQNLLNEHLRFFHSPFEITFTALVIGGLILTRSRLKEYKNIIQYAGMLVLFLALVSVHKASYYMILYLPYLIIIITLCFRELKNRQLLDTLTFQKITNKQVVVIFNFLLLIYIAVNAVYDFKISTIKYNNSENNQIVRNCFPSKTDSLKIVAPLLFVFNEIQNFKAIQGDMCYTELKKANENIYKGGFLQLTKKFDIDYIILQKGSIEELGVNKLTNKDFRLNHCKVLLRSDILFIIKNIKPDKKIILKI